MVQNLLDAGPLEVFVRNHPGYEVLGLRRLQVAQVGSIVADVAHMLLGVLKGVPSRRKGVVGYQSDGEDVDRLLLLGLQRVLHDQFLGLPHLHAQVLVIGPVSGGGSLGVVSARLLDHFGNTHVRQLGETSALGLGNPQILGIPLDVIV